MAGKHWSLQAPEERARAYWQRRYTLNWLKVKMGVERARADGHRVRFLVLTIQPTATRSLTHAWNLFVRRVSREFGRMHYATVGEITKNHLLHLHAVIWGTEMMPQKRLLTIWRECTGLDSGVSVHVSALRSSVYAAKYIAKELTMTEKKGQARGRRMSFSEDWFGDSGQRLVARLCLQKRAWETWRAYLSGAQLVVIENRDGMRLEIA